MARWSAISVLPLLLLGVSGCWLTEEEVQAKIDVEIDTGTVDPLVLSGITPGFGPTTGGTEVTIAVGPLMGTPEVLFGSNAATVVSQSATEVVVTAPAALAAGAVPVTITDTGRELRSSDAFTYYEDRTGLTGVIGALSYVTYVGDAWGTQIERPADYGLGWISFIEPASVRYSDLSYGMPLDTCSSSYAFNGTLYDQPLNAASITLSSPSASQDFAWSAQDLEFYRDMTLADFRPGTTFDLEPISSPTFPSQRVEGFVRTPLALQVTEPEFDTWINSSFTVSWSQDERADYILLRMDLYSDLFGTFVESVLCRVADDGSFYVDGSQFSEWVPLDTTLRLGVGRAIESDASFAHDNSEVAVAGVYWVFGLAYADL